MQAKDTPIAIRPATPADMAAIGRLGALLVRLHHDFDPQRFLATTSRTEHAYGSFLDGQLKVPDVIILVAARGADVLGYTYVAIEGIDYLTLRGPAGLLHDLVVAPDHRGQGIGRMLLDATLAELRARGAPRVVLWAAAQNAYAQRLFEQAGFRRTMIEMTRELPVESRGGWSVYGMRLWRAATRHPRRAASMTATSIFFMVIIAAKARWASALRRPAHLNC